MGPWLSTHADKIIGSIMATVLVVLWFRSLVRNWPFWVELVLQHQAVKEQNHKGLATTKIKAIRRPK